MDWLIIVIIGIPEFGNTAAKLLSDKIHHIVKTRCNNIQYQTLTGNDVTRNNVLAILNSAAKYLAQPNKRVMLYYNGHGDQTIDKNGDEADGRDEYWKLMGGGLVVDDQLSQIFNQINEKSFLWLIADNCSSGTMIDRKLNNRPWILLSACQDNQDATACIDGGVFTLFGLLPSLSKCNNMLEIKQSIAQLIDIPTQTVRIEITRPYLWNIPLWS